MSSLAKYEVENCFDHLKLYSDGSVFRKDPIHYDTPFIGDSRVIYKDIVFNEEHNLSLRVYKPTTTKSSASSSKKLPILFHFHGGGFCFGSRTSPTNHNMCVYMAKMLEAVVIEPDHRLAPEHRLPAAIDDACDALRWLQSQARSSNNKDDTLLDGTDFDRVFVLGYSSGGNLAHHLAVRFRADSADLAPVRLRGYMLLSPFFGGTVQTKSEKERPSEGFWTVSKYDRFWRLAVPIGENQDNRLVNPFGPLSQSLAAVVLAPMLVVVGGSEIMRERVNDYATKLQKLGKRIEYVELKGETHGYFTTHPLSAAAKNVIQISKSFMYCNSN
ncbi:hypothetical protein Ddye_026054 [Dipteronia dyeriana]|uniref:Alpha/beta hydrolase fold-3 domain-containing protein n=1 Tax=Dipteronia dyeriana TaxID=168575 RepID=A0AAD9TLE6_9ROSI|nr:hypothetical protein Ddye_026054 [Dipteronia dyeriana]